MAAASAGQNPVTFIISVLSREHRSRRTTAVDQLLQKPQQKPQQ